MEAANVVTLHDEREEYVKQHFPSASCGAEPVGNKILVQLRTIKSMSSGGILLANDTQEFNNGNTRIAIVRKLGHIAFKNRETGVQWGEGAWAEIGDVVIIPAFGGFRFDLDIPGSKDKAIFATLNDYAVEMVIRGNFSAFDKVL